MRTYRLLFLDKNGRLLETEVADCDADHEAIEIAQAGGPRSGRRFAYVEVWDGGRPVCMYARPIRRGRRLLRRLAPGLKRRQRFPTIPTAAPEHATGGTARMENRRRPTARRPGPDLVPRAVVLKALLRRWHRHPSGSPSI